MSLVREDTESKINPKSAMGRNRCEVKAFFTMVFIVSKKGMDSVRILNLTHI